MRGKRKNKERGVEKEREINRKWSRRRARCDFGKWAKRKKE